PPFSHHTPPPTQTYTLSLHDALPISERGHAQSPGTRPGRARHRALEQGHRRGLARAQLRAIAPADSRSRADHPGGRLRRARELQDRKSTRLNSSHVAISYAVFCLKKK